MTTTGDNGCPPACGGDGCLDIGGGTHTGTLGKYLSKYGNTTTSFSLCRHNLGLSSVLRVQEPVTGVIRGCTTMYLSSLPVDGRP